MGRESKRLNDPRGSDTEAQAIFGTLFNLHLLAIGYTADHIGTLQSLSALLIAAIAIPIGLAGDRWGQRGLYVTGSILFSVPYLIMQWLTSCPLLLGFSILGTVGNTLMFVNKSPCSPEKSHRTSGPQSSAS